MQNQSNPPVTELLRGQHRQVEVLFEQVIGADGDARTELFDCLRATLAVHETAEELVVHPAARRLGEDGERIVEARLDEEGKAKEALAELEKLTVHGEGFGPKLLAFKQDVLAHAEAEERELFPLLEGSCDQEEQERMAELIRAAEKLAPTHPHPHLPDSALPQLVMGPFVGMIDKVRDKLSEMASRT